MEPREELADAILENDQDRVKSVVKKNSSLLNESIDLKDSSPLILKIIRQGGDVKDRFQEENTPLLLALSLEKLEIAQILLEEQGIDKNKCNKYKIPPIAMLAMALQNDQHADGVSYPKVKLEATQLKSKVASADKIFDLLIKKFSEQEAKKLLNTELADNVNPISLVFGCDLPSPEFSAVICKYLKYYSADIEKKNRLSEHSRNTNNNFLFMAITAAERRLDFQTTIVEWLEDKKIRDIVGEAFKQELFLIMQKCIATKNLKLCSYMLKLAGELNITSELKSGNNTSLYYEALLNLKDNEDYVLKLIDLLSEHESLRRSITEVKRFNDTMPDLVLKMQQAKDADRSFWARGVSSQALQNVSEKLAAATRKSKASPSGEAARAKKPRLK